jgi:hypothetical protein
VKLLRAGCAVVIWAAVAPTGSAAALPADYFKLMEAELKPLAAGAEMKSDPAAMLAAAVLYAKQHPANPSFHDRTKLELALALGDLFADRSEKDTAENKQDYEWEIHFWLDTYRLLETELGAERLARWRKEIEKIVRWFARETAARIDFPRYQGPYIRTSTNHLALFASTVYLAGRVLPNNEWEQLGARALHRLATEEQTEDGYWGEFTDNGPATGYNYLTMCCVALYWEHSRDADALKALRRATDFHMHFTWPDGTPVETINGRNRHWPPSAWGQFGFSHWPDGRRYAELLAGCVAARKVSSRDLGRMAQNALYYHEGPTAAIPQEKPNSAHRMKVPAGIRKTGPWVVCLSGLIDTPIDSQFTLDRQGHLSIYHQKLGLIVTGANSKNQPDLATFRERTKDRVTTIPLSSRLRMGDERDRLGLGYSTFFAEAVVPKPIDERVTFRFAIAETGRGRLQDVQLNLQLVLKAGEALETAKKKLVLDEKRIELGPDEIGGWIRHRGWTLGVDPTARLVWPVLPFNPYRNAPETDLVYAVGVLSVPVKVHEPPPGGLNWRQGEITFALEAAAEKEPEPGDCADPPATELGKLAAGMKPGTWAELKTEKLLETHKAKGNSGAIFGYNEGAAWDPTSRQWLYVGGDHNDPARFVTYSADTNTWKVMPQPEWLGKSATHGYDHNAIDPARGMFYYRPFNNRNVYRYDIANDRWTTLPKLDTGEYLACCVGLAWFPELDGLVWANGGGGKGHVFLFSEKTQKWTMLAKDLPMGVYHNFAEYSPVHKVVIFGGGNGSSDLYELDAAGKVTALKRAPIGIGTMQSIVTVDPVSGDFLVFGKNGSFHVYDAVKDEWRQQEGKVPIFEPTRVRDNKVWHTTATPVSTYGVTMFVKYYHADPPRAWVYLYKHAETTPDERN